MAHLFNAGAGIKDAEIFFKEEALLKHILEGSLVAYVTLHIREKLANSADLQVRQDASDPKCQFEGFDGRIPRTERLTASEVLEMVEGFLQSISPRGRLPLGDKPISDARVKFGILLLRIARRFEFKAVIKSADYFKILTHLKMSLPDFIGSGFTNYAFELVRFMANILYDLSQYDSCHMLFSMVITEVGKPNTFKPPDLINEDLNLLIRKWINGSSNIGDNMLERISQGVLLLKKVVEMFRAELRVRSNSTSHTEPNVESDILKCASYVMEHGLVLLAKNRDAAVPIPISDWNDAYRIGMTAIANGYIDKKLLSIPPVPYIYKKGFYQAPPRSAFQRGRVRVRQRGEPERRHRERP